MRLKCSVHVFVTPSDNEQGYIVQATGYNPHFLEDAHVVKVIEVDEPLEDYDPIAHKLGKLEREKKVILADLEVTEQKIKDLCALPAPDQVSVWDQPDPLDGPGWSDQSPLDGWEDR